MMSSPRSALSLLHFERISPTVIPGVSSINNGASMRAPAAFARFVHSCCVEILPVRSFWLSINAVEHKRRCTNCSRDISSEKNATFLCSVERLIFFAILRTNAVFPIEGLAATIMKSPF